MKDWEFRTGRQNVYNYIRDILLNENTEYRLNIDESMIYADNPDLPAEKNKLRLSNGISIYQFMKSSYVLCKVSDEGGFDIEDFHFEDDASEEEE